MIIRYAVQLKNGSYMKQDFHNSLEEIKIRGVHDPIDSDLLMDKKTATRVIDEILNGSSNLLVLYDDENPPIEVVEVYIEYNVFSVK